MLPAVQVADAQSAAEYQVYPLKHTTAAEVEKVLGEMLANSGPAVHLVADAKTNQILLKGPEKAQQIARELLASIDRPPARSAPAVTTRPIVRTYSVEKDLVGQTADRLRTAYARRDDVRVAAEPSSGRLFVRAPPAVQEEIAHQLGTAEDRQSDPRAVVGTAEPAAAMHGGPEERPSSQLFALRRLSTEQMETRLRELFGPRLVTLDSARRGSLDYRFIDGRGRRIEVTFDRLRGSVSVSGPISLVTQFGHLVGALDIPVSGDTKVRIVPIRNADPEKVRQAVEAYRAGTREDGRRSAKPGEQGMYQPNQAVQLVSYLFQRGDTDGGAAAPASAEPGQLETGAELPAGPTRPEPVPGKPAAKLTPEEEEDLRRRLRQPGTDVEIEILPDLDAIILRGRDRQVKELQKLIDEIERLSAQTEPAIEVYYLRHVGDEAMAGIIKQMNEDFLGGRQGRVTILPLVKPNALLLVGWGEAVKAAKELICAAGPARPARRRAARLPPPARRRLRPWPRP